MASKIVSYLRVSTKDQGASGLGLEAQRAAVAAYASATGATVVEEVREVESGRKTDRPQLAAALRLCRVHGATLCVAKFDRLSRNVVDLLTLRDSGVPVVAADRPNAGNLEVGMLALFAENEAAAISQRTREALAAAKARGVKLGRPENLTDDARAKGRAVAAERIATKTDQRTADLLPLIAEIRDAGITSARGIARELDARNVPTARGGKWTAVQVGALLSRAA